MLVQTIQTALAPVFLLVAVGGLLNVIAARLARVVDRSRNLVDRYEPENTVQCARDRAELTQLDRRMDVINWSIALCVACGIVVCAMVAMLFLMGSGQGMLETPVAGAFILAMLFLLLALILFMIEVRLAIKTIHVPMELLERKD
mgnify:CR=1 FL=1